MTKVEERHLGKMLRVSANACRTSQMQSPLSPTGNSGLSATGGGEPPDEAYYWPAILGNTASRILASVSAGAQHSMKRRA